MNQIEFSSLAFEDLMVIQQYTEITFGILQWEIYQKKLSDAFNKIRSMPGRGQIHPLLGNEMRYFNVGSHIIMYTFSSKLIFILRIVHQNMDLSSIPLKDN